MFRSTIVTIVVIYFVLIMFGCSSTKMALIDVKASSDKVTDADAYNKVTMVLIDKGFDIKLGNKDVGLLTTEYKKFGALGEDPPFDFYLQIRSQIKKLPNEKVQVTLTPIVKRFRAAVWSP